MRDGAAHTQLAEKVGEKCVTLKITSDGLPETHLRLVQYSRYVGLASRKFPEVPQAKDTMNTMITNIASQPRSLYESSYLSLIDSTLLLVLCYA
jgi:hypothetical protein